MRVLVVTHNYPRHPGDHAGSFVARIAEGVAARGHDVLVVAPHAPGAPRDERMAGVDIRRFRFGPDAVERVAYRGDLHRRSAFDPMAAIGVPLMLAAYRTATRRAAREFAPDVVHAHWWFPGGAFAVSTARPVVVTCHGSDVRLLDRGGWLRSMAARTLGRARVVTTASQFLERDVRRALPTLASPVRTIYMPLDVTRFRGARSAARAATPIVLFVGNLVPSKGVDLLLEAFTQLVPTTPELRLRIVGRGPEEARLRARARDLGIGDRVQWAGFVTSDALPAEYGAASVTVLPSRGEAEGLGLVLAEALLSGCAVVGSTAGGIPEVVLDGVTGLVARNGDAAHLARCIAALLRDAVLRARTVAAGIAHAEELFAPAAAVDRFLATYREAAAARPYIG